MDQVVAARLKSGFVTGYAGTPDTFEATKKWLLSLPVVEEVWIEPLDTYRDRRCFGLNEYE